MNCKAAAALLGAAVILAFGSPVASAADVPYALHLNQRDTLPSTTPDALERNGIVFIDIVRATRIFDGLLTLSGNGFQLSIQHNVGKFQIGSTRATIGDASVKLPAAPFRASGEIYAPIVTIVVKLGGARLHVDSAARVAQILTGPRRANPPATPAPQVSLSNEGGSLDPSLGQALSLVPSGSIDAAGLHVRVDVANATDREVVASFSSGAQVAFVVSKNGAEVWNSTEGKMYAQSLTSLTFAPHSSRSFTDLWPGFAKAGAGRYTLRAKLLTETPLTSPPVSLGDIAPAPAST